MADIYMQLIPFLYQTKIHLIHIGFLYLSIFMSFASVMWKLVITDFIIVLTHCITSYYCGLIICVLYFCNQNSCRVVHLLLDHKANPDLLCNGFSALALAIASGNDLVSTVYSFEFTQLFFLSYKDLRLTHPVLNSHALQFIYIVLYR